MGELAYQGELICPFGSPSYLSASCLSSRQPLFEFAHL